MFTVGQRVVEEMKGEAFEETKPTGEDIQSVGPRRLYCVPSIPMIRPRITKFAATRGVGAMIVVVILYAHTPTHKGNG